MIKIIFQKLYMDNGDIYKLPTKKLKRTKRWTDDESYVDKIGQLLRKKFQCLILQLNLADTFSKITKFVNPYNY